MSSDDPVRAVFTFVSVFTACLSVLNLINAAYKLWNFGRPYKKLHRKKDRALIQSAAFHRDICAKLPESISEQVFVAPYLESDLFVYVLYFDPATGKGVGMHVEAGAIDALHWNVNVQHVVNKLLLIA